MLFHKGNNSRGYYFAKEIIAFSCRDQRPSFDPEGNCVDLRSDLSRTPTLFGVDDRQEPDLISPSPQSSKASIFLSSEP